MHTKKVITILCFFILAVLLMILADTLFFKDKVYPGIYINNIDFGFRKIEEVREQISIHKYEQVEVVFKLSELEDIFTLEELGFKIDLECLASKAYGVGRGSNLWGNLRERYRVFREKENLTLCFEVNNEILMDKMETYFDLIYKQPVNAEFSVKGDEVSIIPGEEGLELDKEESIRDFLERIGYLDEKIPVKFPLIIREIEPEITTKQLENKGIKNLLAKFSTNFNLNDKNRIHNIELSSSLLNKRLLAEDDIFSFNEVVGEATVDKGFKEAPVIIGGEFVPAIGGGICQVSSTLYNAALLAGMEIIERSNHGRAVGYLPPGRDATIAFNFKDLKFKNNLSHHILLAAEIVGNRLIIRIFGHNKTWEKIDIKTTDLEKIEPEIQIITKEELPEGERKLIQSGSPGYRVTVLRIFYNGDEEIKREKLSSDFYNSTPTIYHVGKEEEKEDITVLNQLEEDDSL